MTEREGAELWDRQFLHFEPAVILLPSRIKRNEILQRELILDSCSARSLMPLFRFIFEEDAILDDIAPVEFPNHESAIDAAKKAARETLIDAVIEGCDPTEWVVRIYNSQVSSSKRRLYLIS